MYDWAAAAGKDTVGGVKLVMMIKHIEQNVRYLEKLGRNVSNASSAGGERIRRESSRKQSFVNTELSALLLKEGEGEATVEGGEKGKHHVRCYRVDRLKSDDAPNNVSATYQILFNTFGAQAISGVLFPSVSTPGKKCVHTPSSKIAVYLSDLL